MLSAEEYHSLHNRCEKSMQILDRYLLKREASPLFFIRFFSGD